MTTELRCGLNILGLNEMHRRIIEQLRNTVYVSEGSFRFVKLAFPLSP